MAIWQLRVTAWHELLLSTSEFGSASNRMKAHMTLLIMHDVHADRRQSKRQSYTRLSSADLGR
jgi:hypothetical protein